MYKAHEIGTEYSKKIKWSRNLKDKHSSGALDRPLGRRYIEVNYRPFQIKTLYNSSLFVDEPGLSPSFYPSADKNPTITISDTSSRASWTAFSSEKPIDFHFGSSSDGYKAIPRFTFSKSGDRLDNITDWAFNKFIAHYGKKIVTKDLIFRYVYAVLHDPQYRATYAFDLKRNYPRIPLHSDFSAWAEWGEQLMRLHLNYDRVKPWNIKRTDSVHRRAEGTHPRPILKSFIDDGVVRVDEDTQIEEIPEKAWAYKIGNRSAIDWVLEQHKEKMPRDQTVRDHFNSYCFAEHKESMISLMLRVIRVSIETFEITEAIKQMSNSSTEGSV